MPNPGGKRPGSDKQSKKTDFVADEERIIEPLELPEGARFNGYREYDVQDLILKRHNIRYLLAEYVTTEGRTITGKLPDQQQGHYGVKKESVCPVPASPMPGATAINSGATERIRDRDFGGTSEQASHGGKSILPH